MGRIVELIKGNLTDVYIKSIMVGDNMIEDSLRSFFDNVNEQVDHVCQQIKADPKLKFGFNAIGFSQGSQFIRAYVERCNDPRVRNLVSIGGQHQGVFGLPKCPGDSTQFCDTIRHLLTKGAYIPWIQNSIVQAQYWHDPHNHADYENLNIFLPDINNEGESKNKTYKLNMMSLNRFAMVKFNNDSMIQPTESQWFGFYDKDGKNIIPLRESRLYKEDWLGLRYLDEQRRLDFIQIDGDHLRFSDQWFINRIVLPYLR